MADEESSSKGIPWGVVTGLLALAGGTIAILAPLTSSRPIARTGLSEEGYQDQDVAAHLWQDPLEAMEAHRRRDKEASRYERETHALRRVREQVIGRPPPANPVSGGPEQPRATPGERRATPEERQATPEERQATPRPCEILAVMTQGGADEERIERRLRDRVAVVEGLSRAGFKPESERYIGYFALPWTRKALRDPKEGDEGPWQEFLGDQLLAQAERLEEIERGKGEEEGEETKEGAKKGEGTKDAEPRAGKEGEPARKSSTARDRASMARDTTLLRIPFEWFDREYPGKASTAGDRQLVLWLDADYFEKNPVHRLAQLLALFANENGVPAVDSAILGPESSGTLHAMVEEAEKGFPPGVCQLLSRTTIYSDRASASDAVLTYRRDMGKGEKTESNVAELLTNALQVVPLPGKATNRGAETTKAPAESAGGFHFIRTIPSDEKIFEAVLAELDRRAVYSPKDYGEGKIVTAPGQPAERPVPGHSPRPGSTGNAGNEKSLPHSQAKRLLALLTEEDTFFGRAMMPEFLTAMKVRDDSDKRITFARIEDMICGDHAGGSNRRPALTTGLAPPAQRPTSLPLAQSEFFDGVLAYQYLRGIDGRLPATVEGGKGGGEGETERSGKDGEKPARNDPSKMESPDGTDQSDYLRRLASDLLDGNDRMMRVAKSGQRSQIAVVGVLGSDVYDKLEILHALRKRLPSALFFTNSMDARLFHPAEQSAARNLIVVSAYGLALNEQYQEHAPPFRDSWQTARFAAVLRALGVIDPGIALENEKPRIYEISRTGPWDLSERDDDSDTAREKTEASSGQEPRRAPGATPHADVTPASAAEALPPPHGTPIPAAQGQVSATSSTAPIPAPGLQSLPPRAPVATLPRHVNPDRTNDTQWWSYPLAGTGGLLILLFLILLGIITHMTPPGLRGRVAIRFPLIPAILFILSYELIAVVYQHFWRFWRLSPSWHFWQMWHWGGDDEPFAFFEGISIWPTEALRIFAALLCLYFLFVSVLQLKENRECTAEFFGLVGAEYPPPWTGPVATELWESYLKRTSGRGASWRVALFVIGYGAFAWGFTMLFGGMPLSARSNYARTWDLAIVIGTVLLFFILTFYVVYAILAIRRVIQQLHIAETFWPCRAREHWRAFAALEPQELVQLVDIRFIARRTEAIAPLIYYPFIIISLMILSRMPIFDNWDWPPGLVIVLATNTLVATVCAFLLRSAAEEARSTALEILGEALGRACDGDHKEQLRAAIADVRGVDDGAFAAISQQPVIRAIALQGGGVAVLAAVRTLMS